MLLYGHKNVLMPTVDTDVGVSVFNQLFEELWIQFGVEKEKQWLPIHKYYKSLADKVHGLLF